LGYIPNLSYGKGISNKTATRDKIQDEHDCLAFVLKSLKKIHKNNGFDCTVLGQSVWVKVWIHLFIGFQISFFNYTTIAINFREIVFAELGWSIANHL
jgi:hypothetical protein